MLRVSLLAALCLLPALLNAQESTWQQFKKLSRPEKCWAITHPFIAKKAAAVSARASATANKLASDTILDGDANGGQVDAFRHAYWMATLSQALPWRAAWKLGKAHERGNKIQYKRKELEDGTLPDAISSEMDEFNNKIGLELARENPSATPQELQQLVIQAIVKGEMLVVAKNAAGQSLTCAGTVLPDKAWQGKWENERCLKPSNQ